MSASKSSPEGLKPHECERSSGRLKSPISYIPTSSLGRGAAMSFLRKQKLNVRSSAEGKLAGIDDALPLLLWCRYFIEAQGYTVEQNSLYQDNKSPILLAKNGHWLGSKRMKHIKPRYFFIKDNIGKGEGEVHYQPTERMWLYLLTKPKQGVLDSDWTGHT
eukprot:CCRYP_005629-RA/>CCRYP_005629-RA protein AED:0.13 eAED:-0.11 QI:0/-1/0/1/-1/1/1/0/160